MSITKISALVLSFALISAGTVIGINSLNKKPIDQQSYTDYRNRTAVSIDPLRYTFVQGISSYTEGFEAYTSDPWHETRSYQDSF